MKTHKKVTYTLLEKTILSIDIEHLMESVNSNISYSGIVTKCIVKGFELFEEELLSRGGNPITEDIPKKFKSTVAKTYTIPIWVDEKLDYYSEKLDVKKSHLVIVAVAVVLNGE